MENEQYDSFFIDIYRCWTNCLTMLRDRGYDYPKVLDTYKQNEFYTLYQNKDADSGFNNYDIFATSGTNKLLVKFIIDLENIRAEKIKLTRTAVDSSSKYGPETKIIYILKQKPSQNVLKEVKNTDEVFYYTELVVNRVYHRLVPKHVLLNDAEKRELLLSYDIRDTQLPRMVTNDFVARYFGAKVGDIFRIYRNSPSTGVTISYRIVK